MQERPEKGEDQREGDKRKKDDRRKGVASGQGQGCGLGRSIVNRAGEGIRFRL